MTPRVAVPAVWLHAPPDTSDDVQSCVENFRVDDDLILKVRDIVPVSRRKLVPMTPRVAVPAVWLHARAHSICELRCASCAR
jgi:hypothetical protein